MRRFKVGLLLLCLLMFAGCSVKEKKTESETAREIVQIPVVFRVDPSTNESSNQPFVEDFNTAFEGLYEMDVEWLTETAAGYRNKLKQWNVLDELPAIITDAGFDHDLYQILIKNDRLVDLRPYMEESDYWMDVMNEDILEDCTEADGSIYLSPLSTSIQSYAGIIYDEELLKEAGYDTFPETWEEFFECLEALKAKGITPLALHGSGSYWVPMLFSTAYLVHTEEGHEFLKKEFPESYRNDSVIDMFQMMKKLYDYTFEDALEIDYDQASKRFVNGEAAIIANGYWMLWEIQDKVKDSVKFTAFPGGVLMNSPKMSAWAVTAGYDKEVTEAAVKALEFRIQCEQNDVKAMLAEPPEDPLLADYVETVQQVETVMPNYQMKWEQEIQNEFFTQYMPEYLTGNWDVHEFINMLDNRLAVIRARK